MFIKKKWIEIERCFKKVYIDNRFEEIAKKINLENKLGLINDDKNKKGIIQMKK